MSKFSEHRAALRLKQRQEHAAQQAEQARINAEAEESGAGGIVITDERPESRTLVESSRKSTDGPAENKARVPAEEDKAEARTTARRTAPKKASRK